MWILVAVGTAALATSCDRTPVVPVPTTNASAASDMSAPPSSRPAFLPRIAGSVSTTPLLAFPMTAELPPTWRVTAEGGVVILRGQSPFSRTEADELEILLRKRDDVKPETLRFTLQDYQRQDEASEHIQFTHNIRDCVAQSQVLEWESAGPGGPTPPATTPTGERSENITTVRWVARYYVPGTGVDLKCYEMSVTNMTADRYQADRDFIRAIFDSVRPEKP
jgi:hypothetical protein